jgi:ribonuclease G
MRNEIFVNVTPGETRVALREADKIVDLTIERQDERGVVGGIYKGKVTRVLPGMQAAFVDIGLERAGFLYVGDYRAEIDGYELEDDEGGGGNGSGNGRGGRGRGRRQRGSLPQIEDVLEEGREVIVQVAKEPLGTKGARITSRISLPGRHLVLMPWVNRVGVSRRIESDRERKRLRSVVEKHRPRDLGFIVRTVSHGVSEADIQADIEYLTSLWRQVQEKRDTVREAPALIYEEPPLHLKLLRDMATHETKQIVVDDPDAYGEMQEWVRSFMASPRPRIQHYRDNVPLFDQQRIENEIEEGLGRKVWLKSGGYLIIDQGEALTAVDVNTGRYTGGKGKSLEDTILKTNLEAVREIVHQLRFRNIGGLIILDLIDMEIAANRDKVYKALVEAIREDKSKVNLLKISELGLVEMTRKRTRESLTQQLCEPCPVCEGKGYLQSAQTIAYKIFRELPRSAAYLRGKTLRVQVHPEVAEILHGSLAWGLEKIGQRIERELEVLANTGLHREQFDITSHGERVAVLPARTPEPETVELDEPETVEAASQPPGSDKGEPVEAEPVAAEDSPVTAAGDEEAAPSAPGSEAEAIASADADADEAPDDHQAAGT